MAEHQEALIAETPALPTPESRKQASRTFANILRAQLESLVTYHRIVMKSDEPEGIHKMRVTTRRAQASLDLLESAIKVRPLKKKLRRWRRELSLVRNYDVFLALIDDEAAHVRAAARPQFELVKGALQHKRARRVAKVRARLKGIKINQLAAKLGLTLRMDTSTVPDPATVEADSGIDGGLNSGAAHDSFAVSEQAIASRAAERLEQRMAEFQALAEQSHPATEAAELHQLRIAAKRVRYLMEIVSEMGYGSATRALAWLRKLQDRIGDWHDLEAIEQEIIKLVSANGFMHAHTIESSRMLQAAAHLQKKKQKLVARLFPVRVPKNIAQTAERLARALRRRTKTKASG
jgi:CHAD domain-containing protein